MELEEGCSEGKKKTEQKEEKVLERIYTLSSYPSFRNMFSRGCCSVSARNRLATFPPLSVFEAQCCCCIKCRFDFRRHSAHRWASLADLRSPAKPKFAPAVVCHSIAFPHLAQFKESNQVHRNPEVTSRACAKFLSK